MPNKFKAKSKKFKKDNAEKFDAKSTSSEPVLEEDIDGNTVDVDPNAKDNSGSKASRDKILGDSSTSYLKTTTAYGADIGTSFYTSITKGSQVGDKLADFYTSTTTFIRNEDNRVNKYTRDYDAIRRYAEIASVFAIDSLLREVTVDPTTILYDNVETRKPSNKVGKKSNPEYCEHMSSKIGVRALTVNLDGGMIRGNVTSSNATTGDVLSSSILDKYNSTLRKGTIEVVADNIVAANANDIGIVATTSSYWPIYANQSAYHATNFGKANYYTGQYDSHGYNQNLAEENYITDNVLNKTNAHEKMFSQIQSYNVDNNSILRAISDISTFNVTMNSVIPFTTMMVIYYRLMKKAVDNQLRIGGVIGAPNSTFVNIAQGKKFNLEAIVNSLEKFRRVLIGFPYDPNIVKEVEQSCDPFRLLETSSNSLDNVVLFPTFKFTTNNAYNYSATNISNSRSPSLFDKTKGTKDNGGWGGALSTPLNSTDRRLMVAFRQTVASVAENVPHGSFLDIFNAELFSNIFTSDWVPYKSFKDFSTQNLNFDNKSQKSTIANLYTNIKNVFDNASGTPSITEELFTGNQLNMDDADVSEISALLRLTSNGESFVSLNPIVSAGAMTAYMRAVALFINRDKTFIDNFSACLDRVRIYFKTLEEKIGFQGYYDVIKEDTIPKIYFDNVLCPEFEYNVDKVRDFFSTPFQVDANWAGTSIIKAYPVYSGAAWNEGTVTNPVYLNSVNRQTIYVKKDGTTYTDPLYSRTRWVVYGKSNSQYGFNSNTDTLCYNNDIIAIDLNQDQQYIGEHIFSFYNGNNNTSFFLKDKASSNCISFGWGNYNFYYGMGKSPNRPRFQQRSLCMNTVSDGLFQSPVFAAFENPYETVIKDVYSFITNITRCPIVGTLLQPVELYDNPMEYFVSYIRNTTGLAVGDTLRRSLNEYSYQFGNDVKYIKKKYIGY